MTRRSCWNTTGVWGGAGAGVMDSAAVAAGVAAAAGVAGSTLTVCTGLHGSRIASGCSTTVFRTRGAGPSMTVGMTVGATGSGHHLDWPFETMMPRTFGDCDRD
jgi:hypothetical protein